MAVLISGGTGFVGLNLAEALLARGETVVIAALDAVPPVTARHFARLPGRLAQEVLDVRDTAAFAAALRRHQVDRLLPFAAITAGPERESSAPETVFEVNLLGLLSQLRAARSAGVRRVIVPSSSAVYGESFYDHALLDESAPCVPIGLYGVSKYAVERIGLRLGALWGMDVIAARIGALFGPWERDTGLRDTLSPFWQVLHQARSGGVAVLPSEIPSYTFVYARDVAAALVHLLNLRDPPHRVFNICGGIALEAGLGTWCTTLAATCPGFSWRTSADPQSVTVHVNDTQPRGKMDTRRLTMTGWTARFSANRAFADYRDWVLAE